MPMSRGSGKKPQDQDPILLPTSLSNLAGRTQDAILRVIRGNPIRSCGRRRQIFGRHYVKSATDMSVLLNQLEDDAL